MRKKPIVLVVDDEKEILKLFCRTLRDEKYTVLTANNGKHALEVVNREGPDLVFLDLKLPDASGIEILRQIKRTNENIEVIIVTGYGTMKTARAAMKFGAYDYITKPFDIDYIKALSRDALSPADTGILQKIKSSRILKKNLDTEKLSRIGRCRQNKACLWEIAVKAFVFGQDKISIDWMEDPEIPKHEKVSLMQLAQIIKSNMAKR